MNFLMNTPRGRTLVEIMVALSIAGGLASIAITAYAGYTKTALATQCLANRKAIETAAQACGLEQGQPCFTMGKLIANDHLGKEPKCPSEGVYVWISKAPDSSYYLKLGCSIHLWPSHID